MLVRWVLIVGFWVLFVLFTLFMYQIEKANKNDRQE
jgi:hypothetical protein